MCVLTFPVPLWSFFPYIILYSEAHLYLFHAKQHTLKGMCLKPVLVF